MTRLRKMMLEELQRRKSLHLCLARLRIRWFDPISTSTNSRNLRLVAIALTSSLSSLECQTDLRPREPLYSGERHRESLHQDGSLDQLVPRGPRLREPHRQPQLESHVRPRVAGRLPSQLNNVKQGGAVTGFRNLVEFFSAPGNGEPRDGALWRCLLFRYILAR